MSRVPKFFKKVERSMTHYYVFQLKNGNHILYDSNMRNPIEYGSINIIDGLLSRLPDTRIVTYYDSNDTYGFKKNNRKKPTMNHNNRLNDMSGRDSDAEWVGFNADSKTFYYFELEGGIVALFDEEMGQPVILNSSLTGYDFRSKVNVLVLTQITKSSDIFYFKQVDKRLIFRYKVGSKKTSN
jgi:hypothetical protein